jgi:dienelactone hydrolase
MKSFFHYYPNLRSITFFSFLCILQGCSSFSPSVDERISQARFWAQKAGWLELNLNSEPFQLRAYVNQESPINKELTIYIEGDGFAWVNGQYPSVDPTPQYPMALAMALRQPIGAVAYLARPCQFIGIENRQQCNTSVWTSARFSDEVVRSSNQAIDSLKLRFGAQKINLVGYSGGAAIALLVAARRDDVQMLISIAGNVNPHAWASELGLERLDGSLDTRRYISGLLKVKQVYFIGGQDRVISPASTYAFADSFPSHFSPKVIEIRANGHVCCWVEQWPNLWKSIPNFLPITR